MSQAPAFLLDQLQQQPGESLQPFQHREPTLGPTHSHSRDAAAAQGQSGGMQILTGAPAPLLRSLEDLGSPDAAELSPHDGLGSFDASSPLDALYKVGCPCLALEPKLPIWTGCKRHRNHLVLLQEFFTIEP